MANAGGSTELILGMACPLQREFLYLRFALISTLLFLAGYPEIAFVAPAIE